MSIKDCASGKYLLNLLDFSDLKVFFKFLAFSLKLAKAKRKKEELLKTLLNDKCHPKMYEIKQIEGRGLGVMAVKDISKGTLILKETPQMSHVDALAPNLQGSHGALKIWIKKVVSLFNEMNLTDQAEYMKLHSHFENENSFGLISEFLRLINTMVYDGMKADEILKIIGIFIGNNYENSLFIKTSRFNHSCKPNAVHSEFNEVWAACNIKAGQEITTSYKEDGFFGLRTTQNRQEILLQTWGFACNCEFCQESDDDERTTIQSELQKLIKEVENLQPETSEKCRKMIDTYRQLYKLGKMMKASTTCLYRVLQNGYETSCYGYRICRFTENSQNSEEFKNDCKDFSKAAEAFGKI